MIGASLDTLTAIQLTLETKSLDTKTVSNEWSAGTLVYMAAFSIFQMRNGFISSLLDPPRKAEAL
jgi:hypothetical protein